MTIRTEFFIMMWCMIATVIVLICILTVYCWQEYIIFNKLRIAILNKIEKGE